MPFPSDIDAAETLRPLIKSPQDFDHAINGLYALASVDAVAAYKRKDHDEAHRMENIMTALFEARLMLNRKRKKTTKAKLLR